MNDSTSGRLFQVRVPRQLWPRYRKKILSKRFLDVQAGRAWKLRTQGEVRAALIAWKIGDDRAFAGVAVIEAPFFKDVVEVWKAGADVGANTRAWYSWIVKSHLLPVFGEMKTNQIGQARVEDFVGQRRRAGASEDAIRRDLVVLRAALAWARKHDYAVDPTAWRVQPNRWVKESSRTFDPDKVERFIASVSGRTRALLEVAAATGMRAAELRAFRCEWIRWAEQRIAIPHDQAFSPKGRRERSIPLIPHLEQVLIGWLAGRQTGLVFPPIRRGRGISTRAAISKARKASGIEFESVRDLRHHYLSWLAYETGDPTTVQRIAGHSHLTTTQRYMHVTPTYLEEARNALAQSSRLSSAKERLARGQIAESGSGR